MLKLDFSQYTKHNLVKGSSGETVGVALIRKGEAVGRLDELQVVEVDEDNLASSGYISQAEETGVQMVKEEPKQEESVNISSIFVGDSSDDMSKDENISPATTTCKMSLPVKVEAEDSTAVLVSSLADQILGVSSREGYRGTESNLVNVKREEKGQLVTDPDLEKELHASGVRQGKKELDKPGKLGWLREVVTHQSKGHVTAAYYVSPPHPVTGARKRLKKRKDIVDFLEASGNKDLSFRNFNLNSRFLGLKPEFEMLRTSMASGSKGMGPQKSMFAEYFRDLPMDSTSGPSDYSRKVTDSNQVILILQPCQPICLS